MFTLFFAAHPVRNFADVAKADHSQESGFARYFTLLAEQGILMPPSGYEACFMGLAHQTNELEQTAAAIETTVEEMLGGK